VKFDILGDFKFGSNPAKISGTLYEELHILLLSAKLNLRKSALFDLNVMRLLGN
jgi:hypothetical protein